MRYEVVNIPAVSAVPTDVVSTDETAMLRAHIRQILRKISRPKAGIQYS